MLEVSLYVVEIDRVVGCFGISFKGWNEGSRLKRFCWGGSIEWALRLGGSGVESAPDGYI